MSEPENFLTRWSRRKAGADRDAPAEPAAAKPVEAEPTAASAADNRDRGKPHEEFDFSKLPSLDSIGADTDISPFLQKGVPADLTRAALRRAWSADPAIRDFIGIAENQYDFATGKDIPGFGPLTPADDIARMIAQIVGEDAPRPPAAAADESDAVPPKLEPAPQSEPSPDADPAGAIATHGDDVSAAEHSVPLDVAPQQTSDEIESDPVPTRRPHGGALPR